MRGRADRIIVVGAGPVGLTAALLLAQGNIPVKVVESEPELPQDVRAAGFHPPTLDLLEECGATEAIVAQGLVCPVMQYRDRREGKIVEFDLSLLKDDTRHPYRLQCEQFKLTAWIVEALAGIPGAGVRFSNRLIGLSQDDEGVSVVVESPAGRETLRGAYAIAADGGRSTARKLLDIAFEGKTYEERFLTLGTSFDLRRAIPDICSLNFVADDQRKPYFIFEVPGLWRVAITIPESVSDEQARDLDALERELQDIAPHVEPIRISYRRIYRVHQRVAASFRSGRIFLAGDAAHLNHPAGGLGMNGGLHDAVNLVRRLVRVWHGDAREDELDGYEAQRRPYAINAINAQTDANIRALAETDAEVRARILARWRRMATDRALAYEHLLQASMISSLRQSGMLA